MDANGDVTIRIEVPDSRGRQRDCAGRRRRRLFSGRGVETDILVASAKAYMQALNKMIACAQARRGAQRSRSPMNW
jgi:2-isopropylmalate synthase